MGLVLGRSVLRWVQVQSVGVGFVSFLIGCTAPSPDRYLALDSLSPSEVALVRQVAQSLDSLSEVERSLVVDLTASGPVAIRTGADLPPCSERATPRVKLTVDPTILGPAELTRVIADSGLEFSGAGDPAHDADSEDQQEQPGTGGVPNVDVYPERGACAILHSDWAGPAGRIIAKVTLHRGTFRQYGLRRPGTYFLWVGMDSRGLFRAVPIPASGGGQRDWFPVFYNRNVVREDLIRGGLLTLSDAVYNCLVTQRKGACWLPKQDGLPPPHASASQLWIWVGKSCICSGYGCHE